MIPRFIIAVGPCRDLEFAISRALTTHAGILTQDTQDDCGMCVDIDDG